MTQPGGPLPDAPFRPVRGRIVPLVMAVIAVVLTVSVSMGMVVSGLWGPADQLLLVALGLGIAAFLWRYASIRAVPGPDGLRVRNVLLSRTVTWDEILAVRFPEGDPWVTLELDDTDVLAVMAIQRVDGERGREEALRLAELVSRRRSTPPPAP
ncbi:MAG TPA: PH domain-containing protein [Phycicoccus sp.]|nr:PH domain-containing protein [Phycicoccus sp.]